MTVILLPNIKPISMSFKEMKHDFKFKYVKILFWSLEIIV